jgi:hypothetical protein
MRVTRAGGVRDRIHSHGFVVATTRGDNTSGRDLYDEKRGYGEDCCRRQGRTSGEEPHDDG